MSKMMNSNFPRDFAEASSVHQPYPDKYKVASKIIGLRQFWAASIPLSDKSTSILTPWRSGRSGEGVKGKHSHLMSEERSTVYECEFQKTQPDPELDPLFSIFPNARPNLILKNPASWALTVSQLFPLHDINISIKNFWGSWSQINQVFKSWMSK